nr:hypothetical protein [Tanacetum cinerariifolium]
MVRQAKNLYDVDYDQLHDYIKQNEKNMNASRAKRAARTHAPDASHDDPMDNLTTAMVLLAKSITKNDSTPMNNHLRASSTSRVVGNSENAAYGQQVNGNNTIVQRVPRTSAIAGNTQNV